MSGESSPVSQYLDSASISGRYDLVSTLKSCIDLLASFFFSPNEMMPTIMLVPLR